MDFNRIDLYEVAKTNRVAVIYKFDSRIFQSLYNKNSSCNKTLQLHDVM